MEEMRNTKTFIGKLEGKRPLGWPRLTCNENIKMDRREVVWEGVLGYIWLRL